MASITIRHLDPSVKESLRVQAAANGRSMEEEARQRLAASCGALSLAPALKVSSPTAQALGGKTVLLIIGGSIAAYKALDLIRRLRERGAQVRVILTAAAQAFITPLAAGALAGGHVYTELFSRADEQDIGHIRLAREADAVVVAPCSADRLASMAAGLAADLAGAVLLATRAPVLMAPAMNPAMWAHAATRRNVSRLLREGIRFTGPEQGDMAESAEEGLGRMSEPLAVAAAVESLFAPGQGPLAGRHMIVTSGPTHEPLDPVRYLTNHSSGRQGHAIAAALARLGARVTLVCGPVALADPPGVKTVHVETARQMRDAVAAALPAAAAVFVAAVADWRPDAVSDRKIKKQPGEESTKTLSLVENPDILAETGHSAQRPDLVIGFAAETDDVLAHAQAKLDIKGADWIIANNVLRQADGLGVMGGHRNQVNIITHSGVEPWPEMDKTVLAEKLAQRIAAFLRQGQGKKHK